VEPIDYSPLNMHKKPWDIYFFNEMRYLKYPKNKKEHKDKKEMNMGKRGREKRNR
jgi:hypothetical protein